MQTDLYMDGSRQAPKLRSVERSGSVRGRAPRKSPAGAALAATNAFKTPVYGQNQAPSPGRVIGANDRIAVGFIGLGGLGGGGDCYDGGYHLVCQNENAANNNIVLTAVCDLSNYRVAYARKMIGGDCRGYVDHRKLLENKEIDAVTIATPDHWHADCAIDAAEAGKHIYVEAPLTRYLPEAFALADAVRRNGTVFQIGAPICADGTWHKAAELIQAGRLGAVISAQDSYPRNMPRGQWNYDIPDWGRTSCDLDWERWQGRVHARTPYDPEAYFRWHKYYRFSAGTLGQQMALRLHPLMLATGSPEFPTRVVALGSNPVRTDQQARPAAPERDVPEQIELIAEFASGLHLLMTTSTINWNGLPSMIRGHKAVLELGIDNVELKPQKEFSQDIDPESYPHPVPSGRNLLEMEKNWFDCIRSGKPTIGNIDLALRVQTVISLAEMSHRLNVACQFDERSRKITTGPDGRVLEPITYGTLENS